MSNVFEGVTVVGDVNTSDDVLLANVRASIRRGHSQVWPVPANYHRVAIVGGGPSLEATLPELRALVCAGAKVVALNGAYRWLLERNIVPKAQILLDARASTAGFVGEVVPDCRYYVSSQCAPETWDALGDRDLVGIWHAAGSEAIAAELDAYYLKNWVGIAGGTTVGTRAIGLLRTLGFLRFDLFGFDSCWMGDAHHAYPQAQNDQDKRLRLTIQPHDGAVPARDFWVAPWHVKQLEDLVLFIRSHGDKFLLNIHGEGLLAYALAAHADFAYEVTQED